MKKVPWCTYENYQKVIVPLFAFQTPFAINMSVIDGGSFKCYSHDQIYETTDPKIWAEHTEKEHTESGNAACVICGTQTTFSHKPKNKKPVCDKCKEDLK